MTASPKDSDHPRSSHPLKPARGVEVAQSMGRGCPVVFALRQASQKSSVDGYSNRCTAASLGASTTSKPHCTFIARTLTNPASLLPAMGLKFRGLCVRQGSQIGSFCLFVLVSYRYPINKLTTIFISYFPTLGH